MRETEPTQITQGEALEWTKRFCDYPASLWTLQYRFRGVGTGFNADATADGDDYLVSVPTTDTQAMGVGKYQWQAWVTEIAASTNKIMIAEGPIVVQRGFTDDTGTVDLRTTAKKILDAIEATLLNSATSDQLSYEISTPAGTRKISKMSRAEQIALRREYAGIVAREYAAERMRNGGKFGKSIVINVREQ
jgi:hypothetical protein